MGLPRPPFSSTPSFIQFPPSLGYPHPFPIHLSYPFSWPLPQRCSSPQLDPEYDPFRPSQWTLFTPKDLISLPPPTVLSLSSSLNECQFSTLTTTATDGYFAFLGGSEIWLMLTLPINPGLIWRVISGEIAVFILVCISTTNLVI